MSGFDDLNRLAVDLTAASMSAQREAPRLVATAAGELEAIAKALCPVDSGKLKRSIGTNLDLVNASAVIGPSEYYGAFVEWGTSDTAPAAFMGPALDRVTPGFVQAIETLGGNIL